MKSTVLFVLLQYIIGFAFTLAGIFLVDELENRLLATSILFTLLIGLICMFAGVSIVGYFHLRSKKALYGFGKAMALSFAGLLLFIILYILIQKFFPTEFGILSLFLPLTGAILGFNIIVTTTTSSEAS